MFLLIDKPKGLSSHTVVNAVRRVSGVRRVGHGGTLDPNATGLLVIGVGRESTKRLSEFTKGMNKMYTGTIVLGEERDTDDVLGQVQSSKLKTQNEKLRVDKQYLSKIVNTFKGEQLQTPPQYSAIKIKGKKAYDVARHGGLSKIEPRKVTIYKIKLTKFNYPEFEIETEVSSGTYIRSLARDIGRKIGIGAYLKDLRRTKIGKFNIANSIKLEDLTSENWQTCTFSL